MARRKGGGGQRKPRNHEKRVNFQIIKADTNEGKPIYELMNRTIEKHHGHLTNARIVVAWHLAWKPDRDGVKKLGQFKKASDLDRELHPYDFVMLLNKDFFTHTQTTDEQREAAEEEVAGEVAADHADRRHRRADDDGHVRRAMDRVHGRDRRREDAVLGPREHQSRHRQQTQFARGTANHPDGDFDIFSGA